MIVTMCLAQVLSMLGAFAFPALLPRFQAVWGLSNAEAGWINGIYFGGYSLAVPTLTGLTDRVDARWVYVVSSLVAASATLGFALGAGGFWSALILRGLAGLGLAGTFIPGMKALVDRLDGRAQARAVSFYTAVFSLGLSLSVFLAGLWDDLLGWRWAFGLASAGMLVSPVLAVAALRPLPPPERVSGLAFLDFRPVLKNRPAMAYILAYATHMWEMMTFRSWQVAFLTFTLGLAAPKGFYLRPTTVAALAGFLAMWASIGGAELALKYGRRRVLTIIMLSSSVFGCLIGFTAAGPYWLVAFLCVLYPFFLQGDSAALHTGVVLSADPARRGVTLAFQSLLGFGAGSVGPLVVGWFLDLTGGGDSAASWGSAFIVMAAMVALGPLILALEARRKRRSAESPVAEATDSGGRRPA
jgi:MFS family permease